MQRKTKYQIFAAIMGAIILGFLSLGIFAGYGGNKCNISYSGTLNNSNNLIPVGSCDCFCCHLFNSQGFESCGEFGLYLGLIIGAILGVLIVHLIWTKVEWSPKH